MLTAGEMAAIQRTVRLSLPDLCTRWVPTRTADGHGGQTETWTSTTNVPCRLSTAVSTNPQTDGNRYAMHTAWVLTLAHDQAISSGDRVTVNGTTYEVTSVQDDQSYRAGVRAQLRRVES